NVMGSATVAKSLLAHDLVDELDLMIEPIVLGGGKSIFSEDGIARRFRLESVTQANTGVLCCRYLPAE
ncbi:MAG TPA: dihydrofolate reductase family protein, partial [Acidimicrobiia bacterium]